jgi:hypothetical protein
VEESTWSQIETQGRGDVMRKMVTYSTQLETSKHEQEAKSLNGIHFSILQDIEESEEGISILRRP